MEDTEIFEIFAGIFKSVAETQELLNSFPPEHVKEVTNMSPQSLFAKMVAENMLNKGVEK